ncbi:MAG TPA: hypothetical protein VFL57_21310 [Bryobacteraceae bacterium]|nr:hypothetical protein [Bryobacteraceae bacterium]
MRELTAVQWLLGDACASCAGASKTGVPSLSIVVVPVMGLAAGDARQSAGWLLPLVCAADIFAVIYTHTSGAHERLLRFIGGVVVVTLTAVSTAMLLR